ncbi:hypothetical protein M8C21_005874 [Ambrosia artemisiifolia]|uniref:Glucan endo-1,3-beta-D-glucosidase n=1 Tax=Ambrosia artemisiifolia TaxID=4212 RepID=A0AAD5CRE0_AMBAR|nr:hypothetical protein M8C21_005874 [Ambrosia artemisiifolia]
MASKLLLLGLLVKLLMLTDAQPVGVCNGRNGDNLPSEQDVVTLFQNKGISRMRIYDPLQPTLEALGGTNIELMIGVPNEALQMLTNQNAAKTWVNDNILRYPNVNFKYIAVGNEVDPNKESSQYVNFVLPAMQNIHNALKDVGLDGQIKVSTATYTGLLDNTSPPSGSVFKGNVQGFIEPIVKFLAENKLPMLANIYPYFGYLGDPNKNLQYALFTAQGTVVNDGSVQYSNLFDAMLDAHYVAQARVGGENVEIVVSESGWPSEGGEGATVDNAGTYYKNLIEHLKGTTGTPTKQGIRIETYLFAMFDENKKGPEETEKHFGIFSPDQQLKYDGLSFN